MLFQDVRYSVRTLSKAPGFSVVALLALALGIGANTAVFSVIDTVLLKPMSFPDSDRIVFFFVTTPEGPSYGASATKFNVWRRLSKTLDDVSAYEYNGAGLNLGGSYPQQVRAIRVSANYFRLFGVPLAKGRGFSPEEDRPGGGKIVILSHGLWQSRFAGDAALVGKAILLGGVPHTVVGIVGPGFGAELDTPPDVWLPFQIDTASNDHAQYFSVAARLKPGATIAAANQELQPAAAEFHRKHPNIVGPRDGFGVRLLQEDIVADVRPSLLVLAAAVSFVLLIACANVASLLLVRATGRRREIALRTAAGASPWRIVRQLLTESIVLSAVGGGFGLALGRIGVRTILRLNPGDIPRIGDHGIAVTLDWRLAVFTLGVSLITGVLFGLIPAIDASRIDLVTALKDGGGRSSGGLRQNKARALLVVIEVALSVVLLVGAALLIRTFSALRAVDLGADTHNVLTLRMSLAGSPFRTSSDVNRLIRDGAGRIEALPTVTRVAASYTLPLEGAFGIPFNIAGRPRSTGRYDGRGWLGISPGYFDVFKIPILRGRAFTDRDDAAGSRVTIINHAMARQFWPNDNPIGERLILGAGYGPGFEEPEREIVGVVADVHDSALNINPTPLAYVPLAQTTDGITALAVRGATLAWIVRTRVNPRSISSAVEAELRRASGGLSVDHVRSMDELVAQSTSRAEFNMSLLTIFGGSALILSAIGIYGLMAYVVRQRTQELGIRVALGAQMNNVRNMILFEGMRLTLVGIAIGLLAAFALSRLIQNLLFGVKAWDPLVFITVPVVLGVVALVSVWIPALRATRVDLTQAHHSE